MKTKWVEARGLEPIKSYVFDDNGEEKEVWLCPYCDSMLMDKYYTDIIDYHRVTECRGCGCTWSD